jgi:hypothetical protein
MKCLCEPLIVPFSNVYHADFHNAVLIDEYMSRVMGLFLLTWTFFAEPHMTTRLRK